MERQDTKTRIIKETLPSEVVSIIGSIFAGIVLTILIIPFESFPILILLIPALLSLRGNISGPFIARTSRDIIIGEFNLRNWVENTLATYSLAITTTILIGLSTILLNIFFIKIYTLNMFLLILVPIISMSLSLSVSIPASTTLNYIAFRFGLNPNNIVNPIMTALDDFFSVFSFYLTLIMLGVP